MFVSGDNFIFPREKRNARHGVNTMNTVEIPSIEKINAVLEKAKNDSLRDIRDLGVNLGHECEQQALSTVSFPPVSDPATQSFEEPDTERIIENNMAVEPNVEDNIDIQTDAEILNLNIDSLNIRDFSGKINNKGNSNDSSLIEICINEKKMIVRKSTLCWYFFEKHQGRLSSDRLIRCKSLNTPNTKSSQKAAKIQIKEQRKKPSKKRKGKKLRKKTRRNSNEMNETSNDETSEDQSDDLTRDLTTIELLSEFENESFSDYELDGEISNNQNQDENSTYCTNIKQEEFYGVFYDDTWYIGRIVEILPNNKFKIKFLKKELDELIWPVKDDFQVVKNEFIFHGPINILGNYPFRLKRHEKLELESKYKAFKQCSQL